MKLLLWLLLLLKLTLSSSCPSDLMNETHYSITSENIFFSNAAYIKSVLVGPVTENIYMISHIDPQYTHISINEPVTMNEISNVTYDVTVAEISPKLSSDESKLYFLSHGSTHLTLYETSTANSEVTVREFTGLKCTTGHCHLFITSEPGYAYITASDHNNVPILCWGNFTSSQFSYTSDILGVAGSSEDLQYQGNVPTAVSMYADDRFFMALRMQNTSSSVAEIRMVFIDYSEKDVLVHHRMSKTGVHLYLSHSYSLIDSEESKLYASLTISNLGSAFFAFDLSTGDFLKKLYEVDSEINTPSTLVKIEDTVYFSYFRTDGAVLLLYNTVTEQLDRYQESSNYFYTQLFVEPTTNRLLMAGKKSNYVTWMRFPVYAILFTDVFVVDTSTINSSGGYSYSTRSQSNFALNSDFIAEDPNGVSLDTVTSVTSTSNINIKDYAYVKNDKKVSVATKDFVQIPFAATCSLSSVPTIHSFNFQLQDQDVVGTVSWVTFDATEFTLNIMAECSDVVPAPCRPVSTQDVQTYNMHLNAIDPTSGQILASEITIEVYLNSCTVDNCKICDNFNNSLCTECATGYELSTDGSTCNTTSNSTETSTAVSAGLQATSTAFVAATGAATALFSLCNLSTPSGLWMTMNQFQLILLLLLSNTFIPKIVVDYLTGLKVTTCSFNFIPFKEIPGLKTVVSWLDHEFRRQELDYFGVFSGSSFVNNFSLICIFILIGILHSLFTAVYACKKKSWEEKGEKVRKGVGFVYQVFNVSVYVRLLLMANQFLILSSLSEIYEMKTGSAYEIISFGIAIVNILTCIALILVAIYQWWTIKDMEIPEGLHLPFKELLSTTKENSLARLYSTLLLSRRFLLVSFLTLAQSLTSSPIILFMTCLQTAYVATLILIRPLKEVKDNVMEIVNELFFFLLVLVLNKYDGESRWSYTMERVYLCLIISNSVCIIFIMIVAMVLTCAKKFKKKTPVQETVEVVPKQPSCLPKKSKLDPSRDMTEFYRKNEASPNMPSHIEDNSFVEFRRKPKKFEEVKKPKKTIEYWSNYHAKY